MKRATGKTYRTVLKSLINASKGKTVFHVSQSIVARDVAFNHGVSAIQSIDAGVFVNRRENLIEFVGGGRVEFIISTLSHVILERDLY